MKLSKEVNNQDRLLATYYFENEEYFLIFSYKSEVNVINWVVIQRIFYNNTQCNSLEKEFLVEL